MLGSSLTEALHLRVDADGQVMAALRLVAAELAHGLAVYDAKLELRWANAPARTRLAALTGGGPDTGAEALFSGSQVIPRWGLQPGVEPLRAVPVLGVDLERQREVLRAVAIPVVTLEGQELGFVLVLPGDGKGDGDGPTELPVTRSVWHRALAGLPGWVAMTRPGNPLQPVGGEDEVLLAGVRRGVAERLRSASREIVAEAEQRFREGAAVAGTTAVTAATPSAGLVRGQLEWLTVMTGDRPLAKVDLFHPLPEADGESAPAADLQRVMVDAAPDVMMLLAGTRILAVSAAARAVLGRPPEDLEGQEVTTLAAAAEPGLDDLAGRLATGLERPWSGKITVDGSDGDRRVLSAMATPAAAGRTVMTLRPAERSTAAGGGLSRIAAMLAVAELAADAGAALTGALELVREELEAEVVELVQLEVEPPRVVESFRDPPGAAGSPAGASAGRLVDYFGLLAVTTGPLAVDAESGAPASAADQDQPSVLVLVVPTSSPLVWMLLVQAESPVVPTAARSAAQSVGWVVDRVSARRHTDEIAAERELLRAALDLAQPGQLVLDREARVVAVGRNAAARLGTRPEDLEGTGLTEIYDGELAPRLAPPLEILRAQGGAWEGDLSVRAREGRTTVLRLVIEAVQGPDGTITGFVVSLRP